MLINNVLAKPHPGRNFPLLPFACGVICGGALTLGLIGLFPAAPGTPLQARHEPAPAAALPPAPTAPDLAKVKRIGPATTPEPEANLAETAAPAPEGAPAITLAAAILPLPKQVREELSQPKPVIRTISIGRGDTLMKVMLKAGAERGQAHAAITALSKLHDPRRLQPGQEIKLTFEGQAGEAARGRLLDVRLEADIDRSVIARLDGKGGFRAETVIQPLLEASVAARGRIDDSLYRAAEAARVPARVIIDLIRLYSFDVDFQRDIQPGDRFEVLYGVFEDANGAILKHGGVRYARLVVGGKALPLYRFKLPDGEFGYFNDKGESVRKALMKTPVDGARLSSRYGKRRHPILGYTKMHRGVDFAAPRGTPIMAAGDGKVESAGWNGGYGRYVRLRHNSEYKTAYAHMTRIAKGIAKGRRVRQGQIIGYVGSTGRSTGAHLHYEVYRAGRRINPLGLKLPTGRKLTGKQRIAFQKVRSGLDERYGELASAAEIALGE